MDMQPQNTGNGADRSQDVLNLTLKTRSRFFYFDLRENQNGFFVKISEKSMRGRNSIMFDGEDLHEIIEQLQKLEAAMQGGMEKMS